MGLITKEVEVTLCSANINYFENLGYEILREKNRYGTITVARGTKILVKVEDLVNCSSAKVEVKCDNCNIILPLMQWRDYLKYVKSNGKYYCKKCASNLYGNENARKTKLKNSKSFEQWCVEFNRQDVLNRFNCEKNNCLPSEISYATNKKYYFKCPDGLHKSELKSIHNFIQGKEGSMDCSICNSLGQLLENKNFLYIWSDRNDKSPYEYTPKSKQKVWWKCPDCKHNDYPRSVDDSNKYDFRCPECGFSKGESKIQDYLLKNNITYVSQKTFNELFGTGGGLLSYDFYLPQFNMLIEYQGEFHDGSGNVRNFQSKKALEKQIEHDKRKKEYANKHNINLLEIWYKDFDNIEEILDKQLNIKSIQEAI